MAQEITSSVTIIDNKLQTVTRTQRKTITVITPTTTDTGDTIVIDLSRYKIQTFLGINGYVHTTTNSVVVAEAPTTSVTGTTLTITTGGSAVTDKKRVYDVIGCTASV